jgi:DNA-directed RNA polymerase specialized sigma24 family protein
MEKDRLPPDPMLLPFLQAKGEPESRRQLERLLKDAEEVILGILRRKVRASGGSLGGGASRDQQTIEDLRGEVMLRLLQRLNGLKDVPGGEPITHFRGLAATATYHVYNDYLRAKHPRRAALKKKLAYLLMGRTNQQGLALWTTAAGEQRCGFTDWQGAERAGARGGPYQQLLDDPQRFAQSALRGEVATQMNPGDLLAALFSAVGGPMEFNDLVHAVAELWGVRDQAEQLPETDAEGEEEERFDKAVDPRENVVATEVEQREHLRRLWAEIRELSPRQCAALLLNLKDAEGCGVIELLELRGIASFREIAEVLAMPAEQFARLANDLPIDDTAIAAMLGCTRQQVINLRKVARERLERRVRGWEKAAE